MTDDQTPSEVKSGPKIEPDDAPDTDVTLERLADVLKNVLEIPAAEGLDVVIRSQVARATAQRPEPDEPAEG